MNFILYGWLLIAYLLNSLEIDFLKMRAFHSLGLEIVEIYRLFEITNFSLLL